MNYESFLRHKKVRVDDVGFNIIRSSINTHLFEFQKNILEWSLRKGRSALFLDCGLGKSLLQLEWANQICKYTGGNVLIFAPLAVTSQTIREHQKFHIETPIKYARSQAEVESGITIANYEMLEHFNPSAFVGVVLDESSILKAFSGKIKNALVKAFTRTPYRLACTATPAPNDHLEIGNHAEFLGVMPSNEMISRWFINDTMNFGSYRLKGHATKDFWQWVASWAVCIANPSALGYTDTRYTLPKLNIIEETLQASVSPDGDTLFDMDPITATTLYSELRHTLQIRTERAAEIVSDSEESFIVWCNTNDESGTLKKLIPDAVEVRGSDNLESKAQRLEAFTTEKVRVIITKPSIAGFGLNWQHCHNVIFVGLSYSYEQLYQAIRRSYRFGQTYPVNVHLVMSESERSVFDVVHRKMVAHQDMQDAMFAAGQLDNALKRVLAESAGHQQVIIPNWLHGDQITERKTA